MTATNEGAGLTEWREPVFQVAYAEHLSAAKML